MTTTSGQAALLDGRATADYLGVSPRTLEAWRLRGVGPAYVKLGGLRRYRRADLDAWVGRHVQETADAGRVSA
jgi:excisionase family DNA binding protein